MASTSETSLANNLANFESLITSADSFGRDYNPSRENLKTSSLKVLLADAKSSFNAVYIAQSAYSNAVAARESAFAPQKQFVTRLNNALKATDTTVQVDESALTIVRKLQGKRASAKLTDEEIKAFEAEGKEVNQISASQMDYDSQVENFNKLVTLFASIPQYAPNEEELKVTNLWKLHDELKTKNTDVVTTTIQLSNARITRNYILDKPLTGLQDIGFDTKVYIKSVFGATSPQYKQVSKLIFKKRK